MPGDWVFKEEVHLPLLPFCHPQSLLPAVFSIRSNWFPTQCKSQEVYQQRPTPGTTTDRYWNKPVYLVHTKLHHTFRSTRLLLHQVCLFTWQRKKHTCPTFLSALHNVGSIFVPTPKYTKIKYSWKSRACQTLDDLVQECFPAEIQVGKQKQRTFFLPISPPGTAYWRSFCSANRDTIRENMARHCNLPSLSFETIPGLTSISWLTYNSRKRKKRKGRTIRNY